MGAPARKNFRYFLIVVTTFGFGLFLFCASSLSLGNRTGTKIFVLLGVLTILGEILPIVVRRGDGEETAVTISTSFSFALLLILGIPYAVVAQGLASMIDDLHNRKPWWKVLFNAGQYAISIAGAGLVMQSASSMLGLEGVQSFELLEFVPILLAGITFFALNNAITDTAVMMSQAVPLRTFCRANGAHVAFMGSIDLVLMALSPVIVVLAEQSLVLIPLLALPLLAVHRSARVTLEKMRLVTRLEDQVRHNEYQATHDVLTGLPNRVLIHQHLSDLLGSDDVREERLAVMMMDLDRFKEVNDALGHASGDILLRKITERLKTAVREEDMVARLGGDEFAVVIPVPGDMRQLSSLAKRILNVFEEPFPIHTMRLHIGASIGIALYPEDGNNGETLMQRADVAMYQAKAAHTGYEFYSSDVDNNNSRRLALIDELREAIDNREIEIHMQPQVDMITGFVRGTEALARWTHPYRGPISPSEFIPLAEHSGLMRSLTALVLDKAIAEAARWRAEGADLRVSVNVAPQTLMDLDLPDQVATTLASHGVPASSLVIEITESGMMGDQRRTVAILERLAEMGVDISIDDFGTGYSSLAHIRRLPISEIKIDRSFVAGMTVNQSDAVIVKTTIDLASNLGLTLVAEGIEDKDTRSELIKLGCDIGQGYLFGRPMPVDEFRAWLREHTVERLPKLHVLGGPGSEGPEQQGLALSS